MRLSTWAWRLFSCSSRRWKEASLSWRSDWNCSWARMLSERRLSMRPIRSFSLLCIFPLRSSVALACSPLIASSLRSHSFCSSLSSSSPWSTALCLSSSALTIDSSCRASISALRRSSFSCISRRRFSTTFCCCSMIISVCRLCSSLISLASTSRWRAAFSLAFSSSSSCSFLSCSFWYSSTASFFLILSCLASSLTLSTSFCLWISSHAFCRACASFCRWASLCLSASICRCCSSATWVSLSS
mmetsp:Transcript_32464/g.81807  ORF Transcript_32464/g.81807 Transcript_32464/m.81807 type:complete len:244 (+) Transcript_32464:2332-3063(+)